MTPDTTEPAGGVAPNETAHGDADVIEFASHRRSRYERYGRSLPHLGDDPDWTPSTFDLPRPVNEEPQRWFDRFRR